MIIEITCVAMNLCLMNFLVSPGGMLSPMSRAGYHNKKNFSPDRNELGDFGYMTPLQVLHQEFTLLNLNSPNFKIETVR